MGSDQKSTTNKKVEGRIFLDLEEFKKIPQVHLQNDGRTLFLAPFLTPEKKWDVWMPVTGHGLIKVQSWPVRQFYYGMEPAMPTDIEFRFYKLLVQHFSYPQIIKHLNAIEDDFVNLCAVLAKLELFDELLRTKDTIYDQLSLCSFASTELEYFFYVLRSMYDHLQLVSRDLIGQLYDLKTGERFPILPNSFADMLYYDNTPQLAGQIAERYKIPLKIAEFYEKCGPSFHAIRKHRNEVDHHGKSNHSIFYTENGFGIFKNTKPFLNFDIWNESDVMVNDIVPLNKAFAFFLNETLKAFELHAMLISSIVQLPKPLVPNHNVYLRTEHNETYWRYRKLLGE